MKNRGTKHKQALNEMGYCIVDELYSDKEIEEIAATVDATSAEALSISNTKDLYAIRQLLKASPDLMHLLLNENLSKFLAGFLDAEYFITKAIYFNKPAASNWFVSYHQDLSISVDQKIELEAYLNWTFKKGQYGVQPPVQILEDGITIRIHLDDTDESNGALRVIPKSHLHGIIRADSPFRNSKNEQVCTIKKGGLMLMKPLTLHASSRSTGLKQRRVIHLELNKHPLAKPLKWLEYQALK